LVSNSLKCVKLFIVVFALLVSDTAACLASGLARCLALTATTVLCALAKVICLDCLDMFHCINLRNILVEKIIAYQSFKVNTNLKNLCVDYFANMC
jgi:hypothetical protein